MNKSRNTACIMPATGERAPERMFVAVRAIAPVAGKPPNNVEVKFATPCATSSQLERWRRPVMPSATTADRSDSTPARNAIVNALGTIALSLSQLTSGSSGMGRPRGRSPNWLPIVVTGRSNAHAINEPTSTAMRKPGHRGANLRSRMMIASATAAMRVACGLNVVRCAA